MITNIVHPLMGLNCLIVLIITIRNLFQRTKSGLDLLFFIYSTSFLLVALRPISLIPHNWSNGFVITVATSIMCLSFAIFVKALDRRKIFTLLRLPIIGFLIGLLLEDLIVVLIAECFLLIGFIVSYQVKKSNNYFFRQYLLLIVFSFALQLGWHYNQEIVIQLSLLFIFLMGQKLINVTRAKLILLDSKV